ncbi:hypothetical protein [Fibrisoma montanum]|nr:hypothetical protein [Fibrisoma montanum]
MTDLYFIGGNNIGGNDLVRFVPVVGIASMPIPATDGPLSDPVLFKLGYTWFTLYGTQGTKSYVEDEQEDDNGPVWSVSISVFFPGDSALVRGQLREMSDHRFVVEVQDNTGLWRRVGTLTEPLTFKYRFTTGDQPGDRRGSTITFSGNLLRPAPIISQ